MNGSTSLKTLLVIVVLLLAGPWLARPALALTWEVETVDITDGWALGGLGYTSIALDASGNPHISYHDGYNNDLKYAAFNGSIWDVNTVDSEGNVGAYTSIALDANSKAVYLWQRGFTLQSGQLTL